MPKILLGCNHPNSNIIGVENHLPEHAATAANNTVTISFIVNDLLTKHWLVLLFIGQCKCYQLKIISILTTNQFNNSTKFQKSTYNPFSSTYSRLRCLANIENN